MSKKITNKYKIGQEVFYIEDRAITKNYITGIYVYDLNDPDSDAWYSFSEEPSRMEDNAMPECDLFPSKEALIKSL